MKVDKFIISDVSFAANMVDNIHIISTRDKMKLIGEIGFLLGSDIKGVEMTFYVRYTGECVSLPNEDENYIGVILLRKFASSISVRVIRS